MTRFRGCIDIHAGQVKQIVGGSLQGDDTSATSGSVSTNFTSSLPSSYYSKLYQDNDVQGTHVIKLGSNPENDRAALEALQAWPDRLQIGGGINADNAEYWIKTGKASHVIVTSYIFPQNKFSLANLEKLRDAIGSDRLVIDLSCRRRVDENGAVRWFVTTNKWQDMTDFELTSLNFTILEPYCSEFLVHAADVEGLCQGIDEDLVKKLAEWCSTVPVTYAGGAKDLQDLELVDRLSNGVVDLTFGSALDIFGGKGVKFADAVKWNESHEVRY
ncbi:hypothetical protein WICPIJ_007362 [Wickerhamomyces pijperi]|uniref:1-(5-phosphoribosyl)-5-[(5-phosphoribosylamino)methylideneamino] imidazole-4-carboxamide isomerase n=1 Tax=Wickerhamomyces pijperi TaxID=599730 RepID=A0A9P8Q2Q9_WICPI|nr:hypothetical protein WICPIJ_007362 [Wickerhamomyces pijperi]